MESPLELFLKKINLFQYYEVLQQQDVSVSVLADTTEEKLAIFIPSWGHRATLINEAKKWKEKRDAPSFIIEATDIDIGNQLGSEHPCYNWNLFMQVVLLVLYIF